MTKAGDELKAYLGEEADTLAHLLRRAEKHLVARALDEMAEEGRERVSWGQIKVLRQLSFGDARATEVARALGISKQAVAQLLAPLIKHGIVAQKRDPRDRRAKIVYFRPKGIALLDTLFEHTLTLEAIVHKTLGDARVNKLKKMLAVIARI